MPLYISNVYNIIWTGVNASLPELVDYIVTAQMAGSSRNKDVGTIDLDNGEDEVWPYLIFALKYSFLLCLGRLFVILSM